MPTSNEKILDWYIRHQTYLIRYTGTLRNQVLPLLADTERDLYDAIVKWTSRAQDNRTLTGAAGRTWQREFEQAVRAIRGPAWDSVASEIDSQLKELVMSEPLVAANIIEKAVPVLLNLNLPPASQLLSIVNSQPFQGKTLKAWMKVTAEADVQRLLSYSKMGIIQGRTPTQIAREIIGTKAAKYTDGISRRAFKDTESVILTLTNGVQNEAKQVLYANNKDIIKREMFNATLDSRTTIVCASNDGKTFKRGVGPIPPLHFRCRSARVPYINPDNLGDRGFDSSTKKQLLREYSEKTGLPAVSSRDALPYGHKTKFDTFARKRVREMVGQVPAQTTYNKWLRTQTQEFQIEVLGPTRAKMFRDGKINLDKFVAPDGDVLSLDELKRKGLSIPDI